MRRNATLAALLATLLVAVPATAQEGEMAADTTEPTEEQMDEVIDEAEDEAAETAEEAADAPPTHDWEFALAPSSSAPDGGGMVQVTEEGDGSSFVVEVTGLRQVDSLDSEERDVNAYTVWVVPSRDRVSESTLAGVIDIDPAGAGEFAGRTDLDTFGIVVTATPDGAPERIGGIPVLTGIPVTSEPAADAAEADEPPAPEADEPPAPGADEPPAPGAEEGPTPEPEPGPEEDIGPEVP